MFHLLHFADSSRNRKKTMDTHFHSLPPLKRFRILQHQREEFNGERRSELGLADSSVDSLSLPAKKRKEPRESTPADSAAARTAARTSTYFLPAKKRIWAVQPDFALEHGYLPFDLNIEYQPQIEEEVERISAKETSDEKEEKKTPSPAYEIEEIDRIKECKEYEKEANEEEEDDGILCAVCQSTDGDPSDPIVFCDGCDLMVHASCYGNPLLKQIPEGDWFCAQCSSSPKASENGVSCSLCPTKGGAMKPMKDGSWAHIVCVLFVPEAFFEDPEGREEINCSAIPQKRWDQKCYICKSGSGCAIDCSEPKCSLSFHVTCGLNEDLCIEYREGKRKGAVVAGFCKQHSELWKKQQHTGKFKIVARQ